MSTAPIHLQLCSCDSTGATCGRACEEDEELTVSARDARQRSRCTTGPVCSPGTWLLFAVLVLVWVIYVPTSPHGFHYTERYGTIVECDGGSYLLTRMRVGGRLKYVPVLRRSHTSRADTLWEMQDMGLNPTIMCLHTRLYVVGSASIGERHAPSIYMTRVSTDQTTEISSDRRLLNITGCVERYYKNCALDGKFSAIVDSSGTIRLYIRANMCSGGGCRQVQTTRSYDSGDTWSPFVPLVIDNVTITDNIYFFDVYEVHGGAYRARFPAVFTSGASGVFESFSIDGLHWSAPVLILQVSSSRGRTDIHPIGPGSLLMHVNLFVWWRDVGIFQENASIYTKFQTRAPRWGGGLPISI